MKGKLFEKTDRIFEGLLNTAHEEFKSRGIEVEPSVLIERIISPLKDLFLKNLADVLEGYLAKKSRPE